MNFNHSQVGSLVVAENVAQMKNITDSIKLSNERVTEALTTMIDEFKGLDTSASDILSLATANAMAAE